MKKKHSAIPDFSRKRPGTAVKPAGAGEKVHLPNPRLVVKPPSKAKGGGRRGA